MERRLVANHEQEGFSVIRGVWFGTFVIVASCTCTHGPLWFALLKRLDGWDRSLGLYRE